MKTRNFGLYAVAAAIVVVGLLWAGVPVGSLWFLGLIVMCPLMMFFMMRGMQGTNRQEPQDKTPTSTDPNDRHSMH
jgi:cell division protein FtsW (lipid II flippase)